MIGRFVGVTDLQRQSPDAPIPLTSFRTPRPRETVSGSDDGPDSVPRRLVRPRRDIRLGLLRKTVLTARNFMHACCASMSQHAANRTWSVSLVGNAGGR